MHLTDHHQPAPTAEPIPPFDSAADRGPTVERQPTTESQPCDGGIVADIPLRGRALRFVLVDELRQRDEMTVAEMVTVLAGYGFDLGGRASKVISDALRWELARRRVRRLGRGVYCYAAVPRSTARRIHIFAAACSTWLVAVTRTEPSNNAGHDHEPHHRADAPWKELGWLWVT